MLNLFKHLRGVRYAFSKLRSIEEVLKSLKT